MSDDQGQKPQPPEGIPDPTVEEISEIIQITEELKKLKDSYQPPGISRANGSYFLPTKGGVGYGDGAENILDKFASLEDPDGLQSWDKEVQVVIDRLLSVLAPCRAFILKHGPERLQNREKVERWIWSGNPDEMTLLIRELGNLKAIVKKIQAVPEAVEKKAEGGGGHTVYAGGGNAGETETVPPAQIEGQDRSENKRKTYQDLLNEFETAYATYGTTDLTLFRCGEGGIPPEYLDCVGPGPRTIAGAGSGYMLVFSCSGDKKDIGDIYRKLADKAGSKLATNGTVEFDATCHVRPGDIWCAYLFKHGDHQELPDGICKLQNVFLQSIRLIRSLAESGGPEQPTQPTKKTFVEIMQDYYHYFQKAFSRPDSQMRLIRIVSDDVPGKHECYPGAEPDAVDFFKLGGGYCAVSESREIMYLYNSIATSIGTYLIPTLCISPETRDLSGAAIWSMLLYKEFESSRFTIKGYDILTDPLLKSQQYIAQLIVDKNEQLAKEQQELQQQTPMQPATVTEAEKEQKFQPWEKSGDACFVIDGNRIKFHYEGQIKDLKLKSDSNTLNLLVLLSSGSLQASELKDKLAPKTENKASKIVDYANRLLNTKIAELGFSDVPSDVKFIGRDNFGSYLLNLKIHSKEDFERMQLEQPLVDDRKFKNLDDAEKSY